MSWIPPYEFDDSRTFIRYNDESLGALTLTPPESPPNPNRHPTIPFGGRDIPVSIMKSVFLLGMQGTGKSLQVLAMLSGFARARSQGYNIGALILAAKDDVRHVLDGMRVPYYLIDPRDPSGYGWAIAEDYESPDQMQELAGTLIPDSMSKEDYWSKRTRMLVGAIMSSLAVAAPRQWDLYDVIAAANLPTDQLTTLLRRYPQNVGILELFFNSGNSEALAKVQVGMRMDSMIMLDSLRIFATANRNSRKKIALKTVVREGGMLLLAPDLAARKAIMPAMSAMVGRFVDVTATLPDSEFGRKVVLSVDEAQFLGRLPRVELFPAYTRSKGGILIFASQTYSGLKDTYGEDAVNAIAGNCPYAAIMRQQSGVDAEWCARQFGTGLVEGVRFEPRYEYIPDQNYLHRTLNQHYIREARQRVQTGDVMSLPLADRNVGVTSLYLHPPLYSGGDYAYRYTVPAHHFNNHSLPPGRQVRRVTPLFTASDMAEVIVHAREAAREAMSDVIRDIVS